MKNLEIVFGRLKAACEVVGRPVESVHLLAVSKTFSAERIRELALAGQRRFGENYLQEALAKQAELEDLSLEWHFIGPIQSNKARSVAEHFDWVHSVDRLKIAERLNAGRTGPDPLNVCVQVNISGEANKSGCPPEDAAALCREVSGLPGLRLRGLMAIPAAQASDSESRKAYRSLRMLYDSIRGQGLHMDTISAGMSGDLEHAIAEGATIVRVGSALFGSRSNNRKNNEPG